MSSTNKIRLYFTYSFNNMVTIANTIRTLKH